MSARAEIPPLSIAVAYFGSALFFLACGAAGLVWIAPELAAGAFPLRAAVGVTHLFTLGWITLSMMGALHHFVPVALQTSLMPTRCAWGQLALFVPGLVGFTAGEIFNARPLALGGAAIVGVAVLAFAVRLGLALVRVTGSRTARAILVAGGFLVITATFGVLLAGEPTFGWLGLGRAALIALHVHVALVGWVLLTVVAVAQRLLPMFLLSRAPDARIGALSLLLIGCGAAALLAFHQSPPVLRLWLPLGFVAAGLALFLAQVGRVFSEGRLPELDPGMRFAGVGLVFFGISLVLAPFALRLGPADPQRLVLYIAAAVLAALALFVCGHYYRIVPFLVWTQRYAQRPVPGIAGPAALYRADVALFALLCFVTGATTFLVSVAHGTRTAAQAGAVAFACGAALLVAQIGRILFRAR